MVSWKARNLGSLLQSWERQSPDMFVCLAHMFTNMVTLNNSAPLAHIYGCCLPLNQRFSTFRILRTFSPVPHVVVTFSHTVMSIALP